MQVIFVTQEQYTWFAPFCGELSEKSNQVIYGAVDESNGTAVGALVASVGDAGLEIDQICVADAWRHKGIGRQMLRALLLDARQAGGIPCLLSHPCFAQWDL